MHLCVVLMGFTSTEKTVLNLKNLFIFEEEITSCKVWRKKIWFQSESLWECRWGLYILCINCSLTLQLASVMKECECCSSFSLGAFTSIYWYEDVPITLRLPAVPQIGYSGEHSALQKVRYEHLFTCTYWLDFTDCGHFFRFLATNGGLFNICSCWDEKRQM